MALLYQFLIILAISFAGECLHIWLPLPVPASIYGLVLMFVLLASGILKLNQVKTAGKILVDWMPIMFLPAAAGLIVSWSELQSMLVPLIVILIVTTVLVMAGTGRVAQWIIKKGEKKDGMDS